MDHPRLRHHPDMATGFCGALGVLCSKKAPLSLDMITSPKRTFKAMFLRGREGNFLQKVPRIPIDKTFYFMSISDFLRNIYNLLLKICITNNHLIDKCLM